MAPDLSFIAMVLLILLRLTGCDQATSHMQPEASCGRSPVRRGWRRRCVSPSREQEDTITYHVNSQYIVPRYPCVLECDLCQVAGYMKKQRTVIGSR